MLAGVVIHLWLPLLDCKLVPETTKGDFTTYRPILSHPATSDVASGLVDVSYDFVPNDLPSDTRERRGFFISLRRIIVVGETSEFLFVQQENTPSDKEGFFCSRIAITHGKIALHDYSKLKCTRTALERSYIKLL